MAMSDDEIDRLIEKLKQKYAEYSAKNPTWFNYDAFRDRLLVAVQEQDEPRGLHPRRDREFRKGQGKIREEKERKVVLRAGRPHHRRADGAHKKIPGAPVPSPGRFRDRAPVRRAVRVRPELLRRPVRGCGGQGPERPAPLIPGQAGRAGRAPRRAPVPEDRGPPHEAQAFPAYRRSTWSGTRTNISRSPPSSSTISSISATA